MTTKNNSCPQARKKYLFSRVLATLVWFLYLYLVFHGDSNPEPGVRELIASGGSFLNGLVALLGAVAAVSVTFFIAQDTSQAANSMTNPIEPIDLLRVAADNGLQIFCPDAEPNAVVRWYPWDEKNRVSADAGDCVSQGLPVSNYSMTYIAIKKALLARGIPQSTGDA